MRSITMTAAILTFALAACGSPESEEAQVDDTAATETEAATPAAMSAVATLQTAEGQPAGTATATASGDQVLIALNVQNLPAGEHGVHVHTTGACDAPKFTTAGPHWNPSEQTHGLEGEEGQHAGDDEVRHVAGIHAGRRRPLRGPDGRGRLRLHGARRA
jgi:Cu-Zn family superoxide dismutase